MSFEKFAVEDDVVIWRYMDLSKLLDILVNRQLVFPRLDQFEDVYEGHPTKFIEALNYAFSDPGNENLQEGVHDSIQTFLKLTKVRGYISCWHINENESAGMWKLYCRTNESLVIKTNVGKLKSSLITPNSNLVNKIEVGRVEYQNNLEELKNDFYQISTAKNSIDVSYQEVIFSKRPSFEHEKELRVIAFNESKIMASEHADLSIHELKKTTPPIQKIECNVEMLIEEIIIAPDAPQWFVELVRSLVSKLSYSFPISQSDLYTLK